MIFRPIKLIIDPVGLGMGHQHVLIAQIPAQHWVVEEWSGLLLIACITLYVSLVDGQPVLYPVGVEGEDHVGVVCEPVGYERVRPATCKTWLKYDSVCLLARGFVPLENTIAGPFIILLFGIFRLH